MSLVYVMGPSGAGKDTLIDYVRQRVDQQQVVFARRYITRPADAGGESHLALSWEGFEARRAARLFALWWESHGFGYGIGTEIDSWLARGLAVVVSGSRTIWPEARRRYPGAIGVLVDAPPAVRMTRLAARGRENATEIAERLSVEAPLTPDGTIHRIENDGPLATAGETLVRLLNAAASDPPGEECMGYRG